MKKNSILIVLLILFGISQSCISQNKETALRQKHYNTETSRLAIQGYDPISYFSGKPEKGTKTYSYDYKGIIYYFESSKNLDLFKKSADKYEPAYGGWCAYAMGATGQKVEIDPETFKIINGKLYLFYNAYFNNTLPKWNKDEKSFNTTADFNWSKIYK
jgi:YHS domain-containing protein